MSGGYVIMDREALTFWDGDGWTSNIYGAERFPFEHNAEHALRERHMHHYARFVIDGYHRAVVLSSEAFLESTILARFAGKNQAAQDRAQLKLAWPR